MLLFLIGHAQLSDNEQTVRTGGGGSCAAADQLFPLQAVRQVSEKVQKLQMLNSLWTVSTDND